MPLYDYKCTKCGNVDECIRKHTIDVEVCSVCGAESIRQVSTPARIEGGFQSELKRDIHAGIERLEETTGVTQGGA